MVNSVRSKFNKGVFTQEFTDLGIPPTSWMKPPVKQDEQTREIAPAKTAGAGRGGQGGPTAEQLKQAQKPKPTHHENGKPILAPATAEDENANKTLVGKGAKSAAEVFNKDAVNRDPVTLLPKRK